MFDNFREVAQAVIQLKFEAMKYYIEAGRRTQDSLGREMFITLAEDQKKNIATIKDFAHSLEQKAAGTGGCDNCGSCLVSIPSLKELSGKITSSQNSDDLSALQMALEIETRAGDYFSGTAGECHCKCVREFFSRINEDVQRQISAITSILEKN
ncbi:MAG: hypothetical protein PHQ23_05960 [Candidatus Wallbacteria bacterium]|nr:hypothetical protein [Candidatus Wallbacteria bacterium]